MKGTKSLPTDKLCTVQRLWTVFFIQLNEAYQINVLLPMVVFMLRDWGINAAQVGLYQGIFNATFCFCQFLTCYGWGALSDRYGRRLILIVGLIFSSIAIVLLGFATTFPIAVTIRCTGGFFNGNLGVMKAYLADITDSSNRAWAFSILAISWGVGSVIASAFGGLLLLTHDANSEDYIPTSGVLKWWIFENDYPYLLPLCIGGIISTIALILTVIYIHNEKVIYFDDNIYHDNFDDNISDKNAEVEMSSYLSVPLAHKYSELMENNSYSLDALRFNLAVIGPGCHNSLPTPATFTAMRANYDRKSQHETLIKNGAHNNFILEEEIVSLSDLIKKTKIMSSLVIFSLAVLAVMVFNNLAPVFLAQSLNFSSQFIGYNIAFAGGCLLIFTWYLQPWFLKHVKHKKLTYAGSAIMMVATLSMPACSFLFDYTDKIGLLMATNVAQVINVSGASILFVCVMCYVNNSVPNRFIGKANGISQSLAALSRAIGPPLAGAVWSYSYSLESQFAVFYAYSLAVISYLLLMIVASFKLDDNDQLPWEERQVKKLFIKEEDSRTFE